MSDSGSRARIRPSPSSLIILNMSPMLFPPATRPCGWLLHSVPSAVRQDNSVEPTCCAHSECVVQRPQRRRWEWPDVKSECGLACCAMGARLSLCPKIARSIADRNGNANTLSGISEAHYRCSSNERSRRTAAVREVCVPCELWRVSESPEGATQCVLK